MIDADHPGRAQPARAAKTVVNRTASKDKTCGIESHRGTETQSEKIIQIKFAFFIISVSLYLCGYVLK
jgi:hypothetical protein